MRIATLGPGDERRMGAFLRQRIEHSMFLLSNLRDGGVEDRPDHRFSGRYVGAFDGDALVGVACHYQMGNLTVNAPREAAALARAALAASGRPLLGVVGPAPQVSAIAEALDLPGETPLRLDECEGLYKLELADLRVPEALASGAVRGRELAEADIEQLDQMMLRYLVESVGNLDTPELRQRIHAEHEAAIGRGLVWVLEQAGQLIARTGFNARVPEAVQIGGVWTPHELRGRGFARCAVASHLLAARAAGVSTAILFTEDSNIPAQRAYAALGFQRIGSYRLLLLREPVNRPV